LSCRVRRQRDSKVSVDMAALILVVDDEPDVADLFNQHFRRELRAGKFSLVFAASGRDALEHLGRPEVAAPILIFTDVSMPGMTGFDFLQLAKSARPDVPVIMITANADDETRKKAAGCGADAFIVKPIDFAALRSEIDRRLVA
jgi:CheY-like chemotaxis protein